MVRLSPPPSAPTALSHLQCFDFVVAEHLFLNCMVAEGVDARGTTMSGFKCMESYLVYVNSEARLLTRTADTEFTVVGNPFDIRVRWGLVARAVPAALLEPFISCPMAEPPQLLALSRLCAWLTTQGSSLSLPFLLVAAAPGSGVCVAAGAGGRGQLCCRGQH